MVDAFGVERYEVSKSSKGQPGDKRNTKYALATVAGGSVGMRIGRAAGAKAGGTTVREAKAKSSKGIVYQVLGDQKQKQMGQKLLNSKGVKLTTRGGMAGRLAGLAIGSGTYYAYRQSDAGKRNRAESVQDRKRKINAKFRD